MESVIEKIGVYDLLSVLIAGVISVISIRILDLSYCRFIADNVPQSMNMVFLLFTGVFVGMIIQEIGSVLEKNCPLLKFKENGINTFLKNQLECNDVFENKLEIEMARKKAHKILKKTSPDNTKGEEENQDYDKAQSYYIFQKMKESVSKHKDYTKIDMINSLGSLYRSLCVWFGLLFILYIVDVGIRFHTKVVWVIPYPKASCVWKIIQLCLVSGSILFFAKCMYCRTKQFRNYRLRAIVRLYSYYDDNDDAAAMSSNDDAESE